MPELSIGRRVSRRGDQTRQRVGQLRLVCLPAGRQRPAPCACFTFSLKKGECVTIYDDTAIIRQLEKPEWWDYEMPLRSLLPQPWGIAVKKGDTALAAFVGDIVKEWHAADHIQELEKIWHISPSVFAEEMHRRYADPR